jgi:hypothetical protein
MELTTPLASLPYNEQVKKKQREVVIRIRIRNPVVYLLYFDPLPVSR